MNVACVKKKKNVLCMLPKSSQVEMLRQYKNFGNVIIVYEHDNTRKCVVVISNNSVYV